MPAVCPCCGRDLVVGALRCRACGADARAARVEARATFELGSFLTDDQSRALDLIEELRDLAPAVAIWIRQDPAARGPRPDVHPDRRDRVEHLLAELRLVRERIRPKG